MIEVRLCDAAQVRPLQQSVLRPDGPLPEDRPPPAGARHIGAFDRGHAVGAATLVASPWPGPGRVPAPTWQLRAMAVDPGRRGEGIGRRVLEFAEATARGNGVATLWAGARLEALGFYTAAGWSVVGATWIKPGVGPHRWVTQPVGAAPSDAASRAPGRRTRPAGSRGPGSTGPSS